MLRRAMVAGFGFLCFNGFPALTCPFCNVDGPATRAFILTVLGSAILGFGFIFLWSIAAGQYRGVEEPKYRILEIDEDTEVDLKHPDRLNLNQTPEWED